MHEKKQLIETSNSRNWLLSEVRSIYRMPWMKLIEKAHQMHKKYWSAHKVQACAITSVKTARCPENCSYCGQSGHYKTPVKAEKLYDLDSVIQKAKAAKANGATRFCMGGAWRKPPKKDFPKLLEMIKAVKNLGLETCVTYGMLTIEQAKALKQAGLDYYNHNLDTSASHYPNIISTRVYKHRLNTLKIVREAKLKQCCGGIVGLGETESQRIELLAILANMDPYPESVPINQLSPVAGTPLEHESALDPLEFVRIIATTRILMPKTELRLSAGRSRMDKSTQALCFYAGANSLWYAQEKIFTTANPAQSEDQKMFEQLGLQLRTACS